MQTRPEGGHLKSQISAPDHAPIPQEQRALRHGSALSPCTTLPGRTARGTSFLLSPPAACKAKGKTPPGLHLATPARRAALGAMFFRKKTALPFPGLLVLSRGVHPDGEGGRRAEKGIGRRAQHPAPSRRSKNSPEMPCPEPRGEKGHQAPRSPCPQAPGVHGCVRGELASSPQPLPLFGARQLRSCKVSKKLPWR